MRWTRDRAAALGGIALALALGGAGLSGCGGDGGDDAGPGTTETTAAPTPEATLVVTDASAIGAPGDAALSLAEAIELANGTLAVSALSAQEAASVTGEPGGGSADEITFDVPGGRVESPVQAVPEGSPWTVAEADTMLPVLVGNDGDTITGGGVVLANGPEGGPIGGRALQVSSSQVSITGVTFRRYADMVMVQPAGSDPVRDVRIADSRFEDGGGVSLSATADEGTKGGLSGVSITGNQLLGPPEFGREFPRKIQSAVGVTGATLASGGSSGTASLRDLDISDNVIKGFQGGLNVSALQSFSGNTGGELVGLSIERNDITMPASAGDPAIYVWGAVNLGGAASDVRLADIRVGDNTIAGSGYVVLVTGVEHVFGQDLTTEGVSVEGVAVVGNSIRPVNECQIGMMITGSFTEMSTGTATGTTFDGLEIADNDIEGCETGVLVSPLVNWGSGGTSRDNVMTGVVFRGNRVSGALRGVVVSGGTVLANTIGLVDAADAGATANAIRGLTVEGNELTATEIGLLIAGGLADGAPGTVTGNEVSDGSISGASSCRADADVVIASTATVSGNTLSGVAC